MSRARTRKIQLKKRDKVPQGSLKSSRDPQPCSRDKWPPHEAWSEGSRMDGNVYLDDDNSQTSFGQHGRGIEDEESNDSALAPAGSESDEPEDDREGWHMDTNARRTSRSCSVSPVTLHATNDASREHRQPNMTQRYGSDVNPRLERQENRARPVRSLERDPEKAK